MLKDGPVQWRNDTRDKHVSEEQVSCLDGRTSALQQPMSRISLLALRAWVEPTARDPVSNDLGTCPDFAF